jgi:hypothetical protein
MTETQSAQYRRQERRTFFRAFTIKSPRIKGVQGRRKKRFRLLINPQFGDNRAHTLPILDAGV